MRYKDPDIYAAIKLEDSNILGRVIGISKDALTFHSFADDELNLDSLQHMDVFTSKQFFFRDLPVEVISEKKIQDENSFSKMITREITVKCKGPELTTLIKVRQQ